MPNFEARETDSASAGITPNADQVAAVVAGVSTIGEASRALAAAGWENTVAGNRITVNDRVFARYIDQTAGSSEPHDTRWVVYGIGDIPPVRIVVANGEAGNGEIGSGHAPANA